MSSQLSTSHYVLRPEPSTQREAWDHFVNQHPQGHFLQCWGWGELKAASGWHPLRLALWDIASNQIVAAAQVLRRTAPHVSLRLGHLAYIPKGPVLDWSNEPLCDAFFVQLHHYLRMTGAITLRIEVGVEVGVEESVVVLKRLVQQKMHSAQEVQPLRTIILDITPDETTLLAQMKEKWRYNVRLAGRKGVTIRVAETIEDVQAWYALLETTGERDQFGIHTLAYYIQVWRTFTPVDTIRLLLAEFNGRLLAGIFVSVFARQAIYLYGASSNEQRQLMPNYLLQWEAIRWAKSRGAYSYDFWGIPETEAEDEAMVGVYRFKRGWGGRVVQFPGCYEFIYRPLTMKIAEKFLPT
ncbi:MAG: peptidoglycan bridge formation glycyltransferase FemA/FemB family protein [Ktedonobacteraceae bacterium]